MATPEELDRLSSKELHDRAISRAQRHLDVGFLYRLMRALPVAEAATGDTAASDADIFHVTALLHDLMSADEGKLADGLRPLYIEYLAAHDD